MNNYYIYHAYTKGDQPCLEIERAKIIKIGGTFTYVDGNNVEHICGVIYADTLEAAIKIIKSGIGSQYV